MLCGTSVRPIKVLIGLELELPLTSLSYCTDYGGYYDWLWEIKGKVSMTTRFRSITVGVPWGVSDGWSVRMTFCVGLFDGGLHLGYYSFLYCMILTWSTSYIQST